MPAAAELNDPSGFPDPDDLRGTPWAAITAADGESHDDRDPPHVAAVLEQLDAVQRQMDGARGELDDLRRRDDTLSFYMQRLDEELRLAARLQQDFLPKSLPQVGPVRFHALWRPAGYVSGDLYDIMRLDERHVGFYLADAVGHGMPAALLTMFVKHALETKDIIRASALSSSPLESGTRPPACSADSYRLLGPGEALGRLNTALLDQRLSHASFATALYGVIDVDTLELRLAKAGHPCPLLLRSDGSVDSLNADGPLLGIFDGEPFETRTFQLRPGDRILAFTDGIEVAFAGDARSDDPRWRGELVRRRDLPAEDLLAEIATHLDAEAGSLDPRDDLTMLVIDVEPTA